jgi:mono/diheme cytochrome c family protein
VIRYLVGAAGALALAGLVLFVGGRFYEVSAVRQHPGWVYWLFATGRDFLVSVRSADVILPPGFEPVADAPGAGLYAKHCEQCHGAPGVPPLDFALGMMPVPPAIVHAARERSPAEVYWFVRYGLKMSGMPAWEGRMSDPDMWRVTSFVAALPGVTPAAYSALVEAAGGPLEAVEPLPPEIVPGSVAEADPDRGREAMLLHACRTCHLIPGLVGRQVHVGPSLSEAGARRYIAGVLRNTPENMVRWIMDPQEVDPLTAMPDLNVTLGEARDMAAYLYSIAPATRRPGSVAEAIHRGEDEPASGRPATGSLR